jgi:hypothetical protein
MHQMRIWTTQVSSVMLRSKELEIRNKILKMHKNFLLCCYSVKYQLSIFKCLAYDYYKHKPREDPG